MNVALYFAAGTYAAGAVFTFRLVAGKVAWMWSNYPDGGDVLGASAAGTIAGLFWPAVLAGFGVRSLARSHGGSFRELMAERVFRVPEDKRDQTLRAQKGVQ